MKYLFLIACFFASNSFSQVVINEFSAANYDEDDFQPGFGSDYTDWVELYNTGASAVNLAGYHLSDDITEPTKWTFPAGTSIAAGGHLLILADGGNGFSNGYYRTNFKLTQTKGTEYVVFADATGTIIESVQLNYPNKKNDSRGRTTDGATTWGVFDDPTPDASNTNSDDRYALKPVFDIPAGFYTVGATLTVQLSTTEPNSSIRYTLDGSNPNSSSTLYTLPISLMNTTVIRAKTYSTDPNIASSHTETNTYFVNESHSLKVISIAGGSSINTLLNGTQNEPEGTLELFETDGTFLTEATGEFNKHGNDSWAYPQRGVDFISRDQFGNNYALLNKIFDNKNRDEFQKVILKCGASDNYPFEGQANSNYFGEFGGAHIRDAYVQEMSQLGDLRLDERSVEFAAMYVNGDYWGLYDIREKVDDHDFTKHYYDQDRNNLQYIKTWGGTQVEYGGPQAMTDWDNLVDFITLNDMTIQTNYDYVDSVFNTGSLIDYFILNGFIVNSDWLNWNTSWWRGLNPSGDKKKWRYSLWDMDATFNHYTNFSSTSNQSANSDPCDPASLPNLGGQGHVPIWNALKENDEFFADYANRYAELSSTVFSCDSMHNLLDNMVGEIIGEMPAHINIWGGTMAEWQENVDSLHAFIDTRCANIITGLVNCDTALNGPYQLTILVDPPGAGNVQLSSVTPTNYPFTSTYFGGVDISLSADPNQCWEFDYWTIENDTLFPNVNTANVTFDMQSDDTVTLYLKPTNCIYINVQPPGAGIVTVDGNVLNNYPNIESLTDSVNHTFDAAANTGYTFNHWDWGVHVPAPSTTSTNTIIYTYTDDTVTVYFDPIVLDTIVYITNPPMAGTITVDGANINTFPSSQDYTPGANSILSATANTGFTFSNWAFNNNTPLPNATNSNINITWSGNDTCIINFNPIPVDTIVFTVNPVGAGIISVDGTNINTFPSTQTFSQGNLSNLSVTANTGFTFNNWDFDNNIPTPNSNTNNISITWLSNDSAVVNFDVIPTYNITYLVDPVGAGTIDINGTNVSAFPNNANYLQGSNVNLDAQNNSNYNFSYWETNSSNLNPNTNANSVSYNVNSSDTIIAHYDEYITDTLWVVTKPNGAAELIIGNDIITTSPFMGIYEVGAILDIEAIPSGSNIFNEWQLSGVSISDYNTNSFFIFNRQDTLTAYFNNILGIDDLGTDIADLKLYPSLVKNKITLDVTTVENSNLSIDVFNLAGQKVINLFNETLKANTTIQKTFDINLSSGIYLLKINSNKTSATQKIIIVK